MLCLYIDTSKVLITKSVLPYVKIDHFSDFQNGLLPSFSSKSLLLGLVKGIFLAQPTKQDQKIKFNIDCREGVGERERKSKAKLSFIENALQSE